MPTDPKTLDAIAKACVRGLAANPHWNTAQAERQVRAALDEAYDLGRAERDKEWRAAVDYMAGSAALDDVLEHLAALDASEKEGR